MSTEDNLELVEVSYSRPYDTKFMGTRIGTTNKYVTIRIGTTIISWPPFKEHKNPKEQNPGQPICCSLKNIEDDNA